MSYRRGRIPCILRLLTLMVSVFCVLQLHAEDADPDVLELAFITDTHQFGSTADVRMAHANVHAFVDYCNAHPRIEAAIFGGDFYNDYDTDHAAGIAYLQQAAAAFSPLRIPFYTTRGNHDCNGKWRTNGRSDNTQIITDREYYEIFSPLSHGSSFYHPEGIVTDRDNPRGNYYYRDFWQQRLRLIVLNSYDRDSLELSGYHGQQMRWLTETALDFSNRSDAEQWSFVIIGHHFNVNLDRNAISRLMHAYVRGQDYFDTDAGVTFGRRFSLVPRARFIGFIFGHYHEDNYSNWDGYNMITVNRGYATGSETGQYAICFDHLIINTREGTIEERRIGRGQTRTYSYDLPSQIAPGRAFPEAEGMGRYTLGGRQGRICHVTTLDDDGKGSLREAIKAEGARTIVFDVEGRIQLSSPLIIRHDSITIAGQSAPGRGITLSGAPMLIDADQVIVRYLDIEELRDVEGHQYLIVDHVTAHSDTATAISIRHTGYASVQKCIISSGSDQHPALLAGGYRSSYIYNHIHHSPRAIGFSDREGENRWIQVGRNLVTGWRDFAMYGGGHQGEFSIHENYFIPDSTTLHDQILDVASDGTARYYLRGNELKGKESYTRRNIKLINDRPGVSYAPLPQDTAHRPLLHPVARPHNPAPSSTCTVIAAFPGAMLNDVITMNGLRRKLLREAGNGYRPESVQRDSMRVGCDGRRVADVLSYLDRVVQPERSIVVLSENDVHCRIDGYPLYAGLHDPIASDSAHVAFVSCGDFLQGGLAGSITNGHAIVDVMRHIPYAAITLGTHDFDYGRDNFRRLLVDNSLPMVSANLRNVKADTLLLPPYVIRRYGRRSVAFVGANTPTAQVTNMQWFADESGTLLYDLDPAHVYARIQQAVNSARSEGADYVVVLSQLGYEPDRFGISAPRLVANTIGIDAVIDGHSHLAIAEERLPNMAGQEVIYSQAGENFSHVGMLVIDPDGMMHSTLIARQQMRFRDPSVTMVVDSIKNLFMGSAEDYAGRSLVDLIRTKDFSSRMPNACDAGNLVTDAMRWATDADIAWLNVGSIRQSLRAGEVTRGDILEMVPYPNEIIVLEIPGHQLKKVIRKFVNNLPAEGAVFSPVSGMDFTLSQKHDKRYRFCEARIYDRTRSRYLPIDPNRTYRIATTDYCLTIGWRSKVLFRRYQLTHTSQLYSEAVFQYINRQLNGLVEGTSELHEQRGRIITQPQPSER